MNRQGKGKIEYLDYTWSPISGCLHDCSYCYMKRMAARFPQVSMTPAFHENRLSEAYNKKPSIIGVSYSGDMWGKWVPKEWIEQVLTVCHRTYWHRFLFLTKNPKRYGEFEIPENCWCGTSIDGYNKANNDRSFDLWKNEQISQKRKFISLEPYTGFPVMMCLYSLDWLIVGGLTGKNKAIPPKLSIQEIVMECSKRRKSLFLKSNAGYPEKIQEYPEGLKL